MTFTFNTRHFEKAHGRAPRGNGHWAFDVCYYGADGYCQHTSEMYWASGSYAAAKKQVKLWASFLPVPRGYAAEIVVLS